MRVRFARRLFVGSAVIALVATVLLGGVATGVGWWLTSSRGNLWLTATIERMASRATAGGQLEIAELRVGAWGIQANGVQLVDATGHLLLAIDHARAEVRWSALLGRRLEIPHLEGEGIFVDVGADEAGVLEWFRLLGGPTPASSSAAPFRLPLPVDLPDVTLRRIEAVYHTPEGPLVSVVDGAIRTAIRGRDDHIDFVSLEVTGALVDPGPATFRATGRVAVDGKDGLELDDLRLQVPIPGSDDSPGSSLLANGTWGAAAALSIAVERLDLGALDALFGEPGLRGVWSGGATLRGPTDRLVVAADLRGAEGGGDAGGVTVDAQLDLGTSRFDATMEIGAFQLHSLLSALAQPVVLDGVVSVTGNGTRFAEDLVLNGVWSGGSQVLYGHLFDAVDVRFDLDERGSLRLDGSTVDGLIGPMQLEGTVALHDGPTEVRITGPLDAKRLAEIGIEGISGGGLVDAVVRIDLHTERAATDVRGTVTYVPFAWGNLHFAQLTAPFAAVVDADGRITGETALDGSDLVWSELTAATAHAESLAFSIEGSRTEVDGTITLEAANASDTLLSTSVTGPLHVRVDDAHTVVGADLALGPLRLAELPGTSGSLDLNVLDADTTFRLTLLDGTRELLRTAGKYNSTSSTLNLEFLELSTSGRAQWVATRPVDLVVVEGGIADADLEMRSNLGAFALNGRLATAGPLDATLRVSRFQLDHLPEMYPDRFDPLGGSLSGTVRFTGDAADPTIGADLDVKGLNIEGTIRSLDVDGRITIERGILSPTLELGTAREPLATVRGAVPVRGGLADPDLDWDAPAQLSIGLLPGDTIRLTHLTPLLDDAGIPPGQISAQLDVSGPSRDPVFRVAGVAEVEVPGWDMPGRVEFDGTRRAADLAGTLQLSQELYARAAVKAHARTRIGEVFGALAEGFPLPEAADPAWMVDDLRVDATLDDLPAEAVARAMGVDASIGGELQGDLHVSGSPLTPVATGELRWTDGRIGDQAINHATISLRPRSVGPGYDISVAVSDPGGAFTLEGTVPLRVDLAQGLDAWRAGDLAIAATGDLPLALLGGWSNEIRAAEGRVRVGGAIRGDPFSPHADLTATIDGGRLAYRSLGVEARDIDLALQITGQTLRLDRAEAVLVPYREGNLGGVVNDATGIVQNAADTGERPRIQASGTAHFSDEGEVALDGDVRLRDGPWLVATDEALFRVNGDLSVDGVWPALRIRGDLGMVQGRATIDTAELAGAAPLSIDPSLTLVRETEPGTSLPTPPPPTPSVYAGFDVDVQIDLQRNVVLTMTVPVFDGVGRLGANLTSTDTTARLGGKLSVRLERGEPTLVGEVDLLDGQTRMLRSTFDIERGRITWAGGDPIEDANLDISAVTYVPSGGELRLRLTGTTGHPDPPELSSEDYPDANEQMAILVTGRAPEDLTNLAVEGAAQILAQTVFSNLLGGQSVGTLSFDPDGSVRLAVPITPTLHASTVYSPLSAAPETNTLTVEAEWSILPRLILSGAVGDRTQRGNVFWEIRF